jgi:hypothetical protein
LPIHYGTLFPLSQEKPKDISVFADEKNTAALPTGPHNGGQFRFSFPFDCEVKR